MFHLKTVIVILFLCITTAAVKERKTKLSCQDDDGSSYLHGQEVINFKLWCKYKKCRNGEWFVGYRGCISDNTCYNSGQTWNNVCNKMRCTMEQAKLKTYKTEIVQFGCSVDGECKRQNSEWTKDCNSYRCEIKMVNATHYREYVVPKTIGCQWKVSNKPPVCLKNGDVVSKDCQTYRCQISRNGDESSTRKVILETRGCYSLNDRTSCIAEGVTEKFGCSTYKCTYTGKVVEMELEEYGCKDSKGICIYDSTSTYVESARCIQQACTKQGLVTKSHACSYKDQCITEGDTFFDKDTCVELKCKSKTRKQGTKAAVYMQMEVIRRDCADDAGNCYKVGESEFEAVYNGVTRYSCRCKQTVPHGLQVICS